MMSFTLLISSVLLVSLWPSIQGFSLFPSELPSCSKLATFSVWHLCQWGTCCLSFSELIPRWHHFPLHFPHISSVKSSVSPVSVTDPYDIFYGPTFHSLPEIPLSYSIIAHLYNMSRAQNLKTISIKKFLSLHILLGNEYIVTKHYFQTFQRTFQISRKSQIF